MSAWQTTGSSMFQGVTIVHSVSKEDEGQRVYKATMGVVIETSALSPREAQERLAARLQRIVQELMR